MVQANAAEWDRSYDSRAKGEEWSEPWGSSTAQWYGSVYPRIQRFLPVGRILEIAPGYGRWTSFLLSHCDSYVGVDHSTRCIDSCRKRFGGRSNASFHVNDGRSLPGVANSSINFAFSFDSLVHVDAHILASYLTELDRVLAPEGVAFIHHSNLGSYSRLAQLTDPLGLERLPAKFRLKLDHIGILNNVGSRATDVTAASFVELCEATSLHCVAQEVVNWGGGVLLTDAISVVTRAGSRLDRPNRVVRNRLFGAEARAVRRSDTAYDPLPRPASSPA